MTYSHDFNPSSKQDAYVEYIEETEFGTFPKNPAMQWFGAVTNWDDQSKIKTESKSYLAPSTVTSRTSAYKNAKIGEEVAVAIDYMVQKTHALDTMAYALGAKSSAKTTITDVLQSVSIGQAMTNANWNDAARFNQFTGMVCEDYTLSIPESGAVTAKTKWVGVSKEPSAEYKGTGSHASDPCTGVLQPSDLENLMIRGSATTPTAWGNNLLIVDAVGGLELKIANTVKLPRDLNMYATRTTGIKSCVLVGRKITLGLDLTYADPTGTSLNDTITFENINSFKPFDIKFSFDGYDFTFERVRFPEMPFKAGGEDLIADKLTSLPIGDICSGTSAMTIATTPVP